MVGSAISNSATPPLARLLGAVWLAITSGPPIFSPVTVCGSAPVALSMSPRKPWMLATKDHSSFLVMSEVSVQFCDSEPEAS